MTRKFLLAFSTVALSAAIAADSYRVRLFQPSTINGATLKPGEYKVQVNGDRAVIQGNGARVESSVRVETTEEKFANTSVRYANGDGTMNLAEIRLGGTKTKLVFPRAEGRPAGY